MLTVGDTFFDFDVAPSVCLRLRNGDRAVLRVAGDEADELEVLVAAEALAALGTDELEGPSEART